MSAVILGFFAAFKFGLLFRAFQTGGKDPALEPAGQRLRLRQYDGGHERAGRLHERRPGSSKRDRPECRWKRHRDVPGSRRTVKRIARHPHLYGVGHRDRHCDDAEHQRSDDGANRRRQRRRIAEHIEGRPVRIIPPGRCTGIRQAVNPRRASRAAARRSPIASRASRYRPTPSGQMRFPPRSTRRRTATR